MSFMMHANPFVIPCAGIGSLASEVLSIAQDAQIFGNTSKGVFLKTSSRWLVFLAFEPFKGPLTVTLGRFTPALQDVPVGTSVRITPDAVFMPNPGITIVLEEAPIWQPPPPALPVLDRSKRNENLVTVAEAITAKHKTSSLGSVIPALLGLPDAQAQLPPINIFGEHQLELIKKYVGQAKVANTVELLVPSLGAGPGLTPSADDFTLGLLLTLNRCGIPPWNKSDLQALNFQLVEAAYERTTMLSANLIECASRGLANERLINALDWVVTGVAREPEVVSHLLGWGNSSGVDAFSGMALALTA